MLGESLLELIEWDFRIALGFGVSMLSFKVEVVFLYGLLPILNFVGSWILVKPNAVPSAFWGIIRVNELKDRRLH